MVKYFFIGSINRRFERSSRIIKKPTNIEKFFVFVLFTFWFGLEGRLRLLLIGKS